MDKGVMTHLELRAALAEALTDVLALPLWQIAIALWFTGFVLLFKRMN